MEGLEDRLAPAALTWICDNGDWSNSACWNVNRVPDTADDVTINRPGNITVTNTQAFTAIRSLTNAETLVLSGTTSAAALFLMDAPSQNLAGATLRLRSAVLAGAGTLSNQGLLEAIGVCLIANPFTNAAGSTLRLLATNAFSGANHVTIADGFTNSGLIELTSATGFFTSTLNVLSGVLTNTGTITALPGTGGGRNLDAEITNLGTIRLTQNLVIDAAQRTFTNTAGTLDVAQGTTLAIKGGSLGGTTTFGTGTRLLGAGTVDLGGSHILSLPSNFTLASTGANLTLSGAVFVQGPGTFTNQRTFQLTGDAFATDVALINNGTLVALGGGNFILGPYLSGTNSIIRVLATRTYFAASLTFADGFTNNGTIELNSSQRQDDATLELWSGTIVNPVGRTIRALLGTTGGRFLNASVDNEGTLQIDHDLSMELTNRTLTNLSGTITLTGTTRLTLQNGNSIMGDSANFQGPTTTLIDLAGTHTMQLGAAQFILRPTGPRFTLSGTVTINGPGQLVNQIPLELTGDIVNAPLVNQSTVIALGTGNQINGPYAANVNSGIRILGKDPCPEGCGDADLTLGDTGDFTNNGPFELTSQDNVYSATVSKPVGRLINAATLTVQAGTGGLRLISANLDNRGTLSVIQTFVFVQLVGGDHVNAANGILDCTQGDVYFLGSNTVHNFGRIIVGLNRTVSITDGQLTNLVAGTFTGGIYELEGVFSFPNADIVINAANITLTDLGARIEDTEPVPQNGLRNFAVNALQGRFRIENIPDFQIAANFTNNGTLAIGSSSIFSVINPGAALTNFDVPTRTLSGGTFDISGTLRFNGAVIEANASNLILSTILSRILDENNQNALIGFTQNLATGRFTIQNGREFTADAFFNSGDVILNSGGTFRATSPYTQQAGGFTTLNGGLFQANAGIAMRIDDGGTVRGAGIIQSDDVDNRGLFSPGGTFVPGGPSTIGRITIRGNYRQNAATGRLLIELAGTASFDTLELTVVTAGDGRGNGTFAGTVTMQPIMGFNPTTGMSFRIIDYVARTGTFNAVPNYNPTYGPNNLTLQRT